MNAYTICEYLFSIRSRNRAEITVIMCEQTSFSVWFSFRRKSHPVCIGNSMICSTLGTRDFFSRLTRSFVGRRPTRLRPLAEDTRGKVSGTQGRFVVTSVINTMTSDISKLLYVISGEWNLRQFWNIKAGIYTKYHVQITLLFVYTTTRKRFVIFTCRYFKLSWNTTALSQSNSRNFSRSSTKCEIAFLKSK